MFTVLYNLLACADKCEVEVQILRLVVVKWSELANLSSCWCNFF